MMKARIERVEATLPAPRAPLVIRNIIIEPGGSEVGRFIQTFMPDGTRTEERTGPGGVGPWTLD